MICEVKLLFTAIKRSTVPKLFRNSMIIFVSCCPPKRYSCLHTISPRNASTLLLLILLLLLLDNALTFLDFSMRIRAHFVSVKIGRAIASITFGIIAESNSTCVILIISVALLFSASLSMFLVRVTIGTRKVVAHVIPFKRSSPKSNFV